MCFSEFIRKNIFINLIIIFIYEKLMEVEFVLKRRNDLEKIYEVGKDEFFCLIKVYEELKNFNKWEDVLLYF